MATKSTVPTVANGDSWSAAQQNTYLRDNIEAVWPYTDAGDLAYASAANQLSRLALDTGYKFLRNGASAPVWGGMEFCVIYHSTTQNINTGTATALLFNGELTDVPGWHSTSVNTSRITVTATGYYQASVYLQYGGAGGAGTYMDTVELRINGEVGMDARSWVEVSGFAKKYIITAPIFSLTAGQYVEWYLEQNSGGTRTVEAYANASLLRIA